MRTLSFITLSLLFAASNAREWKPIFSCPGTVPSQLPPEDPNKTPYDSLLEKEKLFDIKYTSKKSKQSLQMEDTKKKAFVKPPNPVSPTFIVVGV